MGGGNNTGTFDFNIMRYDTNGHLDPSFGSGGLVTTDFFNNSDTAFAVAIQPNGMIVAAGAAFDITSFNESFALARYNGDGASFDICLQDDSNGSLLQINPTTGDYQFSNCGGLTIGGTGTLTKRGSLITLQHNSADCRVTATIDTATGKATASIQLFSQGRTFTITDRNINNNTCSCR